MENNLNCPHCGRYSDCEESCPSRKVESKDKSEENYISNCCKYKMQEKDGGVYCRKCGNECEAVFHKKMETPEEELIKNYAHDYRDMNMNEEKLEAMLRNFLHEWAKLQIEPTNMCENCGIPCKIEKGCMCSKMF